MKDELKQAYDKAIEGIKHDSEGLLETDELLRDEILSLKMDYLLDCVGALGRLIVRINLRTPVEATRKFNDEISAAHEDAMGMMIRSLKEYKERKCEK